MPVHPIFFDTLDRGDRAGEAPAIRPWKQVPLEPQYSGAWVVTGDVDGDGQVEIVSARNVNVGDVHYTSAVVAQRLDGRVLWRWGDPRIGRRGLHHDVACQIYDWDGDGRNEVVVCTKDHLVELDGTTGEERRRLPLPQEATDCVAFANLSGRKGASAALVKTRYSQIWAFDYSWKLLWTVQNPGGFPTAHQPVPIDIDNDGRDEIMAGYALLAPEGRVRWALADAGKFAGPGHLDCCRVLRRGDALRDWRLVLACCSHNRLIAVDGAGEVQWELTGHHFESIDIGRVRPERPDAQVVVDVCPWSGAPKENALWLVDGEGVLLGQLTSDYCRSHTLVDWNGDGLDEIVLPYSRGLFDHEGSRIGTFIMETQPDIYGGMPPAEGEVGHIVLRGDMTGDGIPDITITAPYAAYVFRNESRREPTVAAPLGCGTNFSLY